METFVNAFQRLLLESPRYNLKQVGADNCDYADTAVKSRNCYYCFGIFILRTSTTHGTPVSVSPARVSRSACRANGVPNASIVRPVTPAITARIARTAASRGSARTASDVGIVSDAWGSIKSSTACSTSSSPKRNMSGDRYHSILEMLSRGVQLEIASQNYAPRRRTWPFTNSAAKTASGIILRNAATATGATIPSPAKIASSVLKRTATRTVRSGLFENELCYQCIHSPLNYNCNFLFHCDYCGERILRVQQKSEELLRLRVSPGEGISHPQSACPSGGVCSPRRRHPQGAPDRRPI